MIAPKIKFKYSWIYDKNWQEWAKVYGYNPKKDNWPSEKKILNYIKEIKKLWDKEEKRVLEELSKVTGLSWKEKEITCYVVGRCRPFSDPLTMGLRKNRDSFIDVFIHELIHQLFTQDSNMVKSKRAWQYINKKYKKESLTTRIHIPLHAIHTHIFNKFYGEDRLNQEMTGVKNKDYVRSWRIVNQEDYKNIIQNFTSRIS